jgi:hypothetical protein
MKPETISITEILYYILPVIIVYCMIWYSITDKHERKYGYSNTDEKWFLTIFLTEVICLVYFQLMNGHLKIIL